MKAQVLRDNQLVLEDVAVPVPGEGQVLVKSLFCGICGSDLHALKEGQSWADLMARSGMSVFMDCDQDVIMGHEFSAEVVEYGPGTRQRLKPGTRVTSMPLMADSQTPEWIGFSNKYSGAYGEYFLLPEESLIEIPASMSSERAALAEPVAVASHAANRGNLRKGDVPMVIGCGPVGLNLIAVLKAKGHSPIIAVDFSPKRRELAKSLGADLVINPAEESPYENWEQMGLLEGLDKATDFMMGIYRKLNKVPLLSWDKLWRLAELSGAKPAKAVVFECVGRKGVIDQIIQGAPIGTRIVVAGLCMEQDYFDPAVAIHKEIDLCFSLGYTPYEFSQALKDLASGKIAVDQMITAKVALSQVDDAVDMLKDPEQHAKILIDHSL